MYAIVILQLALYIYMYICSVQMLNLTRYATGLRLPSCTAGHTLMQPNMSRAAQLGKQAMESCLVRQLYIYYTGFYSRNKAHC